jgi:hypothetical protein
MAGVIESKSIHRPESQGWNEGSTRLMRTVERLLYHSWSLRIEPFSLLRFVCLALILFSALDAR